ncbi:type II and III secretion system protein family protein [uncultured Amphritea sp.]|mgnify:FL=1|uniref:type II and III secretion system protein family protein n=1 Tax=uncultured Amphritea sp. TaxID=981605 RepID=UPI0025F68A8A|nr:type II and III secretion system protein family protein [uncultured Amphritea sp.]
MQYLTQYPIRYLGVLVVLMILLSGSPVSAQELARSTTLDSFNELTDHNQQVRTIWVPLYKSHILKLNRPVKKVSIGNPDIADILIMRSDQLYVLGRGLGTTNVLLWDSKNKLISAFDIEVTHDLNTLKAKLFQLLPDEDIKVHSSQGAIVLSGEVTSLSKMNTAMEIANSFTPPTKDDDEAISSVVNLMGVGGAQQVMLKVTVAEVSRDVSRKMGIKFNAFNSGNHFQVGAVSGGAKFPDAVFDGIDAGATGSRIPLFTDGGVWGPAIDEFAPNDLSILDKGLFASYLDGNFLFSLALDAAKENGSAKILAEPTLTTLSGQEASFLSGGEFPVPVPNEDGITIDFKEFGIGLKFIPVVLDSKRINMKLNISVSELTSATSISFGSGSSSGFFVPALTKRSASSTVELADGQTIGIAGLMNENMREVINKFPGLGDIPVLGNLFRSQEFEKGETELVILVTPQLATPVDRGSIPLPTDNFVEPSDFEFYILGKTLGSPDNKTQPGSTSDAATTDTMTAKSKANGNGEAPTDLPATSFAAPPLPTIGGRSGGMESSYGHSIN